MVEIFFLNYYAYTCNTDASFHLYLEMMRVVNWNFSDGLNSNNLSPIASLGKLHKVSAWASNECGGLTGSESSFQNKNFFNLKTGNWAFYINMILLG